MPDMSCCIMNWLGLFIWNPLYLYKKRYYAKRKIGLLLLIHIRHHWESTHLSLHLRLVDIEVRLLEWERRLLLRERFLVHVHAHLHILLWIEASASLLELRWELLLIHRILRFLEVLLVSWLELILLIALILIVWC